MSQIKLDTQIYDCLGSPVFTGEEYSRFLNEKFNHQSQAIQEATQIRASRILGPNASPCQVNYRCLVKYAVRENITTDESSNNLNKLKIGLFSPGTHDVVESTGCITQHPAINSLLEDLKVELEDFEIPGYNEQQHSGNLRYLCIRASHLTGELMVTFVCLNLDLKADFVQIIHSLNRRGHKIVGSYIDINAEPGNHIYGYHTVPLLSKKNLRENLDQLSFVISPTSFFQVNPWQAEQIYRRISELVGSSSSNQVAWDLYSGTGQIAMFLCKKGYSVVGLEEIQSACDDALINAANNGFNQRFTAISGKVVHNLDVLSKNQKIPSVIVVNPSRKGIDPITAQFLANILKNDSKSKPLFLYLSCSVESFVRDLKFFKENNIELLQAEAFDMFPQTDHLEWLGVLG